MKRLLMIALFLTLITSVGLSEEYHRNYFVNSHHNNGKLVQIDNTVYCLGASRSLGLDVTVYKVTDEKLEPVIKRGQIQKIYAYQGKLLLIRDCKNFFEMFTKGEAGKTVLEIFDTETKELRELNIPLPESATAYSLFVVNDIFYSQVWDENGQKYLWCYANPDTTFSLPLTQEESCCVLPSCLLLKAEKSLIGQKYYLSILDYESTERAEIEKALPCTNPNEIILEGSKIFYLSDKGIHCWDLAKHTDTLIMHTSGSPNSFSINSDQIWLFSANYDLYQAELYLLDTGALLQSVTLTVSPIYKLISNHKLYVCYPYGDNPQIEWVDLNTNAHYVYSLNAKD